MNIPLSPRLRTCCRFIPKGARVADVGTDHGYLGIWLLQQGIARSVIASDIVPGPLSAAKRNAEKYNCADKMEFCLSDGVQNIPRDFDVLVCAGMGADTMVSILRAAPWLQKNHRTLVLQCQSKTPMLRRYLSESGWRIVTEAVVRDGKFLYTVMEVCWQPDFLKLTPAQWHFPAVLLENKEAETAAYYQWVTEGLRIATKHRPDPQLEDALSQLTALAEEHPWLKEDSHDDD